MKVYNNGTQYSNFIYSVGDNYYNKMYPWQISLYFEKI
jgi:hypothetical protein